MRRIVSVSVIVLLSGVFATAGYAAPVVSNRADAGNPSITFVQGWWEREHLEQRARQGYWRLPPPDYDRYNRLQTEINELQAQRRELDERHNRALQEQHQLLGFGPR
jgi:hypothetical protein